MFFRLSNRQSKELLVRGQQLYIALPVPLDESLDAMAYARAMLPEVEEHISDARFETLEVAIQLTRSPVSIADKLGAFGDVNGVRHTIDVVIATLTPPRCRGDRNVLEWPGRYVSDDGAVWPEAAS